MRTPANQNWASDLLAFGAMQEMERSIYDSLDKIEARDCHDQVRERPAPIDEYRPGLDEREEIEL